MFAILRDGVITRIAAEAGHNNGGVAGTKRGITKKAREELRIINAIFMESIAVVAVEYLESQVRERNSGRTTIQADDFDSVLPDYLLRWFERKLQVAGPWDTWPHFMRKNTVKSFLKNAINKIWGDNRPDRKPLRLGRPAFQLIYSVAQRNLFLILRNAAIISRSADRKRITLQDVKAGELMLLENEPIEQNYREVTETDIESSNLIEDTLATIAIAPRSNRSAIPNAALPPTNVTEFEAAYMYVISRSYDADTFTRSGQLQIAWLGPNSVADTRKADALVGLVSDRNETEKRIHALTEDQFADFDDWKKDDDPSLTLHPEIQKVLLQTLSLEDLLELETLDFS